MSELKLGYGKNAANIKAPVNDVIKNTKHSEKAAKTGKSSAPAVVMSGLAIAGAIGAAIVAIKKGQGAKILSVDKFKEAGNTFVKGKAFTKTGKPFSGVISTIGKNGQKRNLEYVNGMLKEVKTYTPSAKIQGKVHDIPLSKKNYNYDAEGKLESVDKFSWGHVSAKDPKQSGMMYIKRGSTNLDEKRAEGMKKFAAEHPEEARAIKKARKAERKANSLEARTYIERKPDYEDEYDFLNVVSIRGKGKNPTNVTRVFAPDGTLLRETSENKNILNKTSIIKGAQDEKVSSTYHIDSDISVVKHKMKGKNGKYIEFQRSTTYDEPLKIVRTGCLDEGCFVVRQKNVYNYPNGDSLTEYVNTGGDSLKIIRNKKGRILSEDFEKAYYVKPSTPPSGSTQLPPDEMFVPLEYY